jgi:hypothetical protein
VITPNQYDILGQEQPGYDEKEFLSCDMSEQGKIQSMIRGSEKYFLDTYKPED